MNETAGNGVPEERNTGHRFVYKVTVIWNEDSIDFDIENLGQPETNDARATRLNNLVILAMYKGFHKVFGGGAE